MATKPTADIDQRRREIRDLSVIGYNKGVAEIRYCLQRIRDYRNEGNQRRGNSIGLGDVALHGIVTKMPFELS
jgi:hypothetical protein